MKTPAGGGALAPSESKAGLSSGRGKATATAPAPRNDVQAFLEHFVQVRSRAYAEREREIATTTRYPSKHGQGSAT